MSEVFVTFDFAVAFSATGAFSVTVFASATLVTLAVFDSADFVVSVFADVVFVTLVLASCFGAAVDFTAFAVAVVSFVAAISFLLSTFLAGEAFVPSVFTDFALSLCAVFLVLSAVAFGAAFFGSAALAAVGLVSAALVVFVALGSTDFVVSAFAVVVLVALLSAVLLLVFLLSAVVVAVALDGVAFAVPSAFAVLLAVDFVVFS